MDIATIQADQVCILELTGRMDATAIDDFDHVVEKIKNEGQNKILLDMEKLIYISSAGLRSLLGLAKSLKSVQGKLAFCALQPMVAEVFRISGFDRILQVYNDKTAGLSALSA
ncbi:MAG: STAS domain-containing protein [Desulfovibrionaceae bacterium]|nr:STAS domain-containing protein [Desulfovibrionaceae bacterium]